MAGRCRLTAAAATAALSLCCLFLASPAAAQQDFQRIVVGNGEASVNCITTGSNGVLDTTVCTSGTTGVNGCRNDDDCDTTPVSNDGTCSGLAGDDTVVGFPGIQILAGPDGICDTAAAGDDVQEIPAGQGVANARLIISGRFVPADDDDNGICDSTPIFLSGSDDVQVTPVGQSRPWQVAIDGGTNLTLDSTAAGDDVASAILCPGPNSNFDSGLDPNDVLELGSFNCIRCASGGSCITPGSDGVLDTTPAGDDFTRPVVLSGPDGINDTTSGGDDENVIPAGQGFQAQSGFPETTICVDTGADGIAESTLCGNGTIDKQPSLTDEVCDDGNLINGDGCDDDVATGGNCTVSACGNGVVAGTEQCDDGNTNPNDPCTGVCANAFCGDGIRCSNAACTTGPGGGPEECDDGANGNDLDGCTDLCESLICGNGQLDPGESCDDGNSSNNDNCLNNCTFAACGDGFKCTNAACSSGPGNGPEECDPPDGCKCSPQCALFGISCPDGTVNGRCTAPASQTDEVCTTNSDCDDPVGLGNGECTICEECDDGNSANNDGCTNECQTAACGDGFVHELGGDEQCDDGNTVPGDGCDPLCQEECGNGLLDGTCTLGLPFGTACSDNADCDTSVGAGDGRCASETCDVGCGKSPVDAQCWAGGSGDCRSNTDCDTSPGAGDGLCLGQTCGDGCTAGLTGTGSYPDCILGTVGASCAENADCDTSAGAGDGLCNGPTCDTSGAVNLFCVPGPSTCSDETCQIAGCGNAIRECAEECDAGAGNGVAGTGCNANCDADGIIGIPKETTKARECVSAWYLENAPDSLSRKHQRCRDCNAASKTGTCIAGNVGAACCAATEAADCDSAPAAGDGLCDSCDADGAAGTCTFKVGVCLNRLGVPGCDSEEILSFELRSIKVTDSQQATATERITEAVRDLSPGQCTAGTVGAACTQNLDCHSGPGATDGQCSAVILGRCRKGAKNTTCTLGNDFECDSKFGSNNGVCDLGTGVRFQPWLDPEGTGGIDAQLAPCTALVDVVVQTGTRLRLKSLVNRASGKADRDTLKLNCR